MNPALFTAAGQKEKKEKEPVQLANYPSSCEVDNPTPEDRTLHQHPSESSDVWTAAPVLRGGIARVLDLCQDMPKCPHLQFSPQLIRNRGAMSGKG